MKESVGRLVEREDPATWSPPQSTFSTIPDLVAAARSKLEPPVWDYLMGGAGTEWTVRRNRAALEEILFRPQVLVDVRDLQMGTSLLGCDLRIPVFLAPIGGVHRFHPDGVLGVVRAAERLGTLCFISANAAPDLQTICAKTNAPVVLQMYGYDDSRRTVQLLRQAEDAGCAAVCLTVNSPATPWRDRELTNGYPSAEEDADRWAHSRAGFTWAGLQQVRSWAKLPLVLKGVLRPEDAVRAANLGMDVIYVSNLGGRSLDYAPGTVDVLPDIVAAVDDQATVIVDGGFQRGTDVLKGLALGATAVGIGRLQGCGLAAGGQDGLERALTLVKDELLASMAMAGIQEATRARECIRLIGRRDNGVDPSEPTSR